MKKIAFVIALLLGASTVSANVWDDLRHQIIDQTKVTILESGGIASFYDFSVDSEHALKGGILSHVLTNRFISGSIGYYATDNQASTVVGGPTLKIDWILKRFLPALGNAPVLKPLEAGFNFGWDTVGDQHYGFHLMWNFGK